MRKGKDKVDLQETIRVMETYLELDIERFYVGGHTECNAVARMELEEAIEVLKDHQYGR